jgi:hypothetical protein
MLGVVNVPDPIEVAVQMGLAALELLAWAALVKEDGMDADAALTASAMVRLLLRWAGITTDIPAELKSLAAYATSGSPDLPAALALVRNRLGHPPKTRAPTCVHSSRSLLTSPPCSRLRTLSCAPGSTVTSASRSRTDPPRISLAWQRVARCVSEGGLEPKANARAPGAAGTQ